MSDAYATFPWFKVEGCADAELERIAMAMSPAPYAVGYHEASLNHDFDIGLSSVWEPVPRAAAARLPNVARTITVYTGPRR